MEILNVLPWYTKALSRSRNPFVENFFNLSLVENEVLVYSKLHVTSYAELIRMQSLINKYLDHEEARNCLFFLRKIVFVSCST